MGRIRLSSLVSLLSVLCISVVFSQDWSGRSGGRQAMRFNADEAVILMEVGVVVTFRSDDASLRVMPLPMPAGTKADLEEGDEVGMANGKRVKTIAELREAYEETNEGEEFRLGIRREGRARIVTFERKKSNQMPGGGRMVVRQGPGGENEDVFPALGFGIATAEGKTTVNMMLGNVPKEVKDGDEVVALNGKKITVSSDFSNELDATKVGDELTMVFRRDGKEFTVKMRRPEPQGMMMRREN